MDPNTCICNNSFSLLLQSTNALCSSYIHISRHMISLAVKFLRYCIYKNFIFSHRLVWKEQEREKGQSASLSLDSQQMSKEYKARPRIKKHGLLFHHEMTTTCKILTLYSPIFEKIKSRKLCLFFLAFPHMMFWFLSSFLCSILLETGFHLVFF